MAELAAKTEKQSQADARLQNLRTLQRLARDQMQVLNYEGLPSIDRDIQRTQIDIDGAKARIRQFADLAEEWRKLVVVRRQAFQAADTEYQRQAGILGQMTANLATLQQNKSNDETEANRLATENFSLNGVIVSSQQQVTSLQSAIGLYETAIARRQGQISLVATNIGAAMSIEAIALQAFEDKDYLAQQEETETSTAYSLYTTVFNQYNKENGEARQAGIKDGSAAGNREGLELGSAKGRPAGDTQGTADGKARGDKEGRLRDYNSGYAAGRVRGLDASTAPSGKPPPMPLATIMMSGVTPAHSWAKSRPVRPMPHCTSSRIRRTPVSSQRSRSPLRQTSGIGRMPPSPWIGSTMTRPGRVADRGVQRLVVAPGELREAREQRTEALGHLLGARRRDGGGRAAVEGAFEGEDCGPVGWPASCQCLRAILIASSAASVPELVKNTVSAKVLSTSIVGQPLLFGDAVQVREVPHLVRPARSARPPVRGWRDPAR